MQLTDNRKFGHNRLCYLVVTNMYKLQYNIQYDVFCKLSPYLYDAVKLCVQYFEGVGGMTEIAFRQ